jgi:hypothetical protein
MIHLTRVCVEVDHVFEEGNTEEVQQIDKKNSKKRYSADQVEIHVTLRWDNGLEFVSCR